MDEVVCSCLKCQAELGRFKNSWNGIGSTYYSPVYPPVTYINGFETIGDVNQAASGSLVENSFLQDLACRKCQTVIGMRCDSAPEGHMLKKNQLLLRLVLMSVISIQTGGKAVISVQEKFPLTLPGAKKLSTPRRASTVQPSRRSETPGTLFSRKSVNGSMLPPPIPDKSQRDLDKFKTWAENAIAKQKKDIDRIGGAVDRVERAMKSFENFMQETRAELATSRETIPSQEDLASIREDLNGFRDELASYLQIQHPKQQDLTVIRDKLNGLRRDIDLRNEPEVSRHDFGVLIKDVQKVDRKASDIEVVKAELENLKSRFHFLEGATRNASFSKGNEADTCSLIENPIESDMVERVFVDPRTLELRGEDEEHLQTRPGINMYPGKSTITPDNGISPPQTAATVIRNIDQVEEHTERTVKKQVTFPKQKRSHVHDFAEAPGSGPPTKKSRRVIRNPSDIRHALSNKQQPIVISSSRGSSPILGNDGLFEVDLNNGDEASRIREEPETPLRNPIISELRGQRGRPRTVSLNTVPDIIPQSLRRSGRPRAMSQSLIPTISQASPLTSASQSILTNIISYGQLDPIALKQRDASGARLTSAGKVDGRYLRKLKRISSNKENEAPAERIEQYSQPDSQGAQEETGNTSSEAALVLSLEKDSFAIVIPKLRTPEPEPGTGNIDGDKPLRCGVCGKKYKHAWRLERHKLLPACAKSNVDELAEEARKRKMAEREALVKQMLEREM